MKIEELEVDKVCHVQGDVMWLVHELEQEQLAL